MTAAAARLHVTQPTLSRAPARLELETGATLFDRVSGRLRLTRHGRILLLRRYREQMPDVRFELRQAAGHEVLDDVVAGPVDLGVVGSRPDAAGVGWHTLHRERLCLAVPSRHRLARRSTTALEDVAGEPFVSI